jgi:hypothetical protein
MAIPGLTLSGGKLSRFGGHKAVRQYRVWVHKKSGGDDEYYHYSPAQVKAQGGYDSLLKHVAKLRKLSKYARVEAPLAVVYDTKYKKYREVVIDTKK